MTSSQQRQHVCQGLCTGCRIMSSAQQFRYTHVCQGLCTGCRPRTYSATSNSESYYTNSGANTPSSTTHTLSNGYFFKAEQPFEPRMRPKMRQFRRISLRRKSKPTMMTQTETQTHTLANILNKFLGGGKKVKDEEEEEEEEEEYLWLQGAPGRENGESTKYGSLHLPPDVSRDTSEIEYLRRINLEGMREGD